MDQFIDLCILMGCDFLPTLPKIGKQRAYDLIKEYGSLEKVLASLDKTKYPIPEDYNYEGVRQLFKEPDVTKAEDVKLVWGDPDVEGCFCFVPLHCLCSKQEKIAKGLVQFLCKEKGFNEERVRSSVAKMQKNKSGTVQNRLTAYFGAPQKKAAAPAPAASKGKKRDEKKEGKDKNKEGKKAKRFTGK